MNNIINNLFLLGNKFMPEMQLIQLQYRFNIVHVVHLQKIKKPMI